MIKLKTMYAMTLTALFFCVFTAFGANPITYEQRGVYQVYERIDNDTLVGASLNQKNSTHVIQGVTLWWNVESDNGQVKFDLRHSTGRVSAIGADFDANISSTVTILANKAMNDDIRGPVQNLKLVVKQLAAGASAYVRIGYLKNENE